MMKKRAANDILAKITSDDILMEILSCVPVKSLLRFRCVSKTWLSLISSPHFVKLQLNRSIQVNPKIIFSTADDDTYTIDYQTQCYDPKALDFPVYDQLIRGCCNGLLCLSDGENSMALWNPATKEHVDIPYASVEDESLEEGEEPRVVVGFGFDPVMEQYKIVRSLFFFHDFEGTEVYQRRVKVCTLGTGEWRTVDDPPDFLYDRLRMAPQVSGALHWLGGMPTVSLEPKIVSFDIRSEEFRVVLFIECIKDPLCDVTIGVLQGCLSVLVSKMDDSEIQIWMMKEYGVKESWTKLFSVEMPSKDVEFTYTIEPLVLCENGETIVKSGGELYIYNNGTDATYTIYEDPYSCYAGHVYTETLLSIESLVHPEPDQELP